MNRQRLVHSYDKGIAVQIYLDVTPNIYHYTKHHLGFEILDHESLYAYRSRRSCTDKRFCQLNLQLAVLGRTGKTNSRVHRREG
jgi:hypothetical protein